MAERQHRVLCNPSKRSFYSRNLTMTPQRSRATLRGFSNQPSGPRIQRWHALALISLLIFPCPDAIAISNPAPPPPLSSVKPPPTPGLIGPIVVNQKAAVQLGKALFWDSRVGSDGIACGSCHFHAGADRRFRNQLEPGSRHTGKPSGQTFEPMPSGEKGGPNYSLKASDFPLFRLEDSNNKESKILFRTDDVVASAGTTLARINPDDHSSTTGHQACNPLDDPIFHLSKTNTRRVATRNTPTVINAVFNYRNFWDGRANNRFNGSSAFGPRDPDAGVWEWRQGRLRKSRLSLENASLASQAVAPPLDDREMACQGLRFDALARRLLPLPALSSQMVAPDDSILADLRTVDGIGLKVNYEQLIRQAFDPAYWSGPKVPLQSPGDATPPRQIEANFPLFFGLALQLYESTLISDQSRFDAPRDHNGIPKGYSPIEAKGLQVFVTECMLCHQGPTLTSAAHPSVARGASSTFYLVDRREINADFDGVGLRVAFLDIGFTNTSVTPTEEDPGIGGRDPFGYPLSYSEQYFETLLDPSKRMIDPVKVSPCFFQRPFGMDFNASELHLRKEKVPGCMQPQAMMQFPRIEVAQAEGQHLERGRLFTAVQGAFKVPTLRNIELTGPYMHNGSLKNLDEVLSFYDRGGNYDNPHHFASQVFPRPFTAEEKSALKAFLLTLTDERVRYERAPFDHPSLSIPHGINEAGGETETLLSVPATGRHGRHGDPLLPFEAYLPH